MVVTNNNSLFYKHNYSNLISTLQWSLGPQCSGWLMARTFMRSVLGSEIKLPAICFNPASYFLDPSKPFDIFSTEVSILWFRGIFMAFSR